MESHSKTETKKQNPLAFRSLLKTLMNDPKVKVILIGDDHFVGTSIHALLANIDILKESKRKVQIVTEKLPQDLNPQLKHALETKILKPIKPIGFDDFSLYQRLIVEGIPIFGAETLESNPYQGKEDITPLEELLKYGRSLERLVVPNKVFSALINDLSEENTLTIFIGGKSHIVEAINSDGVKIDPGMQGVIKDAKSICLDPYSENEYCENFSYLDEDNQLSGTYDYCVSANEKSLYQTTFSELTDIEEKKAFLAATLHNLIKTHLQFGAPLKKGENDFDLIITVFNNSLEKSLPFDELNKLIKKLLKFKGASKDKNHLVSSFISLFSAKTIKEEDIHEKLMKAINKDLSKLSPAKGPAHF